MATASKILALRSPVLRNNRADGGPIQNSGCGDDELIVLRATGEGVITVGTFVALTGIATDVITDGIINVEDCTSITLHCFITAGSLTGVQFKVFTQDPGFGTDVPHTSLEWDATNNKYNVYDTLFERTLSDGNVFSIHIPLFNYKKIIVKINGIGVATNSEADIIASRGWSPAPLLRA